jgi:uncharacterized membrane protein YfcA
MSIGELEPIALLLIGIAYLLAGFSKGVVGFGVPLIAIPIAATVLPVPVAIGLTAAPILLSNFYQAFVGTQPLAAIRRFWLLIVTMLVGTTLGSQILTRVDQQTMSVVVGAVLVTFVAFQCLSIQPTISPRSEGMLNPLVGLASGLLGGTAGILGPPFVVYLVALRIPKDVFIGTIGLFYFVGIIPLYTTLAVTGVLARDEFILSGLACIPLFAGMFLGGWLRGRISQTIFQRALLIGILAIGINLIRRGLG